MAEKYYDEIRNYAIEQIEENDYSGTYGADLHNELFNTNYYIIGRAKAVEWLEKNVGVLMQFRK